VVREVTPQPLEQQRGECRDRDGRKERTERDEEELPNANEEMSGVGEAVVTELLDDVDEDDGDGVVED
jgi:hypothetical protein